jgi:hypothetical protein
MQEIFVQSSVVILSYHVLIKTGICYSYFKCSKFDSLICNMQ